MYNVSMHGGHIWQYCITVGDIASHCTAAVLSWCEPVLNTLVYETLTITLNEEKNK